MTRAVEPLYKANFAVTPKTLEMGKQYTTHSGKKNTSAGLSAREQKKRKGEQKKKIN